MRYRWMNGLAAAGLAMTLSACDSDSRQWGMVPKLYIIGKVQLRWWPPLAARMF